MCDLNCITNWTIDLNKLPTSYGFSDSIEIKLDKLFCEFLISGVSDKITTEMKTNFKNNVINHIDDEGRLIIFHNNRCNMGRYYSDNDRSLCVHSKYLKHTIFYLLNWGDIDMLKGHQSILRYLCNLNGIEHSIFDEYINYYDELCNKIREHYKVNCKVDLTDDNIKYYFCMVIYGGDYDTWRRHLANCEECEQSGYEVKIIPSETPSHPSMIKFKAKCDEIMELVYENNPDIVSKLPKKDDNGKDFTVDKMKRKTMSYFCGIIENHIVNYVRDYLINTSGIKNNEYLPEYDGICLPLVDGYNYNLAIVNINKNLEQYDIRFKIKPYGEYVLHDVIESYHKLKVVVENDVVDSVILEDAIVENDVVDSVILEDITDEEVSDVVSEITVDKKPVVNNILSNDFLFVNNDEIVVVNNEISIEKQLEILNQENDSLNVKLVATLKDDKITLKTIIAENKIKIKKLERRAKEQAKEQRVAEDKRAKEQKIVDEKRAKEEERAKQKRIKDKKTEDNKREKEKKKADEREALLKDKEIVENDEETARYIIEDLKDRVETFNGKIYLKTGNLWISEYDKVKEYLLGYILKSNYVKQNGDKIIAYAQNNKPAKDILDVVILKLKEKESGKDIYEKFHSSTVGTLSFLDGVLHFKNKKFYKWKEIDFEYYTTQQISYEFGEYFKNPDKKVMNTIKKDIYDNLYGKDVKKALNFLSRAIAGHSEDKNFATYVGNRDCGKGVQYENLHKTFENYVKTFELDNILYERDTNSDESSRKLYWLLEYEYVRIGISQETPDSKSRKKVSGKMLKKLAGGGDTQVARRNYDRKDTEFKIDTTFMFYGNDYLKYDCKDVLEHCVSFTSVNSFKKQEEIDQMKQDGKSELEWGVYKVKKPEIKKNCSSIEWKLATIYLLYSYYVNDAITIKIKTDDDDSNESLRSRILRTYEVTGNDKDIILVTDVENELFDDRKKITIEMESMGVTKKQSNRRDDTKNKVCYFGLIKRVVNENDNIVEETVEENKVIETEEDKNIIMEIEEEEQEEEIFIDDDTGEIIEM